MHRFSYKYIGFILSIVTIILVGCSEKPAEYLKYETLTFPTTDNIVSLYFTNGNEGYVATAKEVYFTSDAGSSFNKVYQSDGREITGVYFVDDKVGFIYGNAGLLVRSANGGTDWQSVAVDNKYRFASMARVDDDRLQIVGTMVSDTVPAPAFMGSSDDKGITWSVSGVPYHGYRKIVSASSTHSWILGSDAVMYTTDGGKTWEHNATRSELKINDFAFSDVSHGWEVSGDGIVRYTDDGGWSWEKKATLSDRALTAVDAPETDVIFIAGDRLIAMTPNHGLKFYIDDVTPPQRLNAVQAVDGKVYYGGDGGTLLRLMY